MIAQAGSAIHTALAGDSTLTSTYGVSGVHADIAPRHATYPFLTFGLVTAPDHYTFGQRSWTEGYWQVRAWDDRPSTERVALIMGRVDAVLTDGTLPITGFRTLLVRRDDSLPTMAEIDTDSGLQVRSAGARFVVGVAV